MAHQGVLPGVQQPGSAKTKRPAKAQHLTNINVTWLELTITDKTDQYYIVLYQ